MEVTRAFTEYAAATRFADLPIEAAERVRLIVFDEIACAVLGRELPAGGLIADYVRGIGGPGAATVLATANRLPPPLAALANGTAGHADEFDGTHVTDGHPGAVVVHAALAVAEARRATGAEFVNAVALGYEIGTRIVAAVGGAFSLRSRHHVHSDHLHGFGAAAASARLIGLGADGHRHALALAAGHAGGLAAIFEERRHMSKALSTGHAAFAGVTGAELAAAGFEGHDAVLDARHGPLGWAEGAPEAILAGLGRQHAVLTSNFKFYSAGYPIHAPVEGALTLMRENGLGPDDLQSVRVMMNSGALDTVRGRSMHSIDVEHMTAVAIVHGELGFDVAHSADAMSRPEVAEMKRRIEVMPDAELDRIQPRGRGAKVAITARDGTQFEIFVEHPRGHALRGGVDWAELEEKWDNLLPRRLGDEGYRRFRDACRSLAALEDIAELTAPLRMEGR